MPDDIKKASALSDSFKKKGFAKFELFSGEQYELIRQYSENWVSELISQSAGEVEETHQLKYYHKWFSLYKIDHENVFRAKNRHTTPPKDIGVFFKNRTTLDLLENIAGRKLEIWDEGLGWLAFRFVRPECRMGIQQAGNRGGQGGSYSHFGCQLLGLIKRLH